ncbi:MAG: L-seryl-tRNA(Sec) selenium transferase [Candidatus Marinimicrobia bacterium]|nr:L-seryl-tRNA(Sec) selenium transferase [Candidatus Neomarinimicrobiota bacterium]
MSKKELQKIPQVNEVILEVSKSITLHNSYVTRIVQREIKKIRAQILKNKLSSTREKYFKHIVKHVLQDIDHSLKNVINGTGVVLHTGLGRAPFQGKLLKKIAQNLDGYVNLELNLKTGKRGERQSHVDPMISAITGTESSLVVNNNAAAVLLTLNTMAEGKEVIISRGQMVEIGGSFRIPDIIEKSGCILKEVGSTNRTHVKDYEKAINRNTGLILWVHTSNYIVDGFTKEVSLKELASLGKKSKIPVLADLGSGALIEMDSMGLPAELPVTNIVDSGPTITTFSGDKLLGGPQSGIIVGKKKWINRFHSNPLYRAVRSDKITLSLLDETLRQYQKTSVNKNNIALTLLSTKKSTLKKRGEKILSLITKKKIKSLGLTLNDSFVEAGSGSLPVQNLESMALKFECKTIKPNDLSKLFRMANHPVLGYINRGNYYIDLKAVMPSQIDELAHIISAI